jgi:LacI family transcriptional regulator
MKFEAKKQSPNKIYDVAGAAGFSLATVSRVLNHPEKVKPATRERIQKIIKELGYKPNLNARGLASSKSTTVAVVVPELTRSSIAGMVDGIADCARRRGYLLRLFVNNPKYTANDANAEHELWGTVASSGVDGVLYINDEITDEQQEIIRDFNVPIVLTNSICTDKSIPAVSIDYKKAAYEITKQMIEKNNKKIWLITSARKYAVYDLIAEGYNQAMLEAELTQKVVAVQGKTELNEVTFREILQEDQPEVALVVRDSMAVSFINVARLLHMSIPGSCQVIGFQNTKYAELSRPKLTCLNTPIYEIGEVAMSLLNELMALGEEDSDKDINLHPSVAYDMVWRETTKK